MGQRSGTAKQLTGAAPAAPATTPGDTATSAADRPVRTSSGQPTPVPGPKGKTPKGKGKTPKGKSKGKGKTPKPPAAAVRWDEPARVRLTDYVRALADRLGLKDWDFLIDWDPTDGNSDAEIRPVYGQKLAVIQLGPNFRTESPEHNRATVAHELIHCHLHPATDVIRVTHERLLDDDAAIATWAGFFMSIEYATDALANVVAPFLPLPPAWS